MTHLRPWPFAVVGAFALVLTGCAVPGEGSPSVAAIYRDRVITNADVDDLSVTLAALGSQPDPAQDLTLLLIGQEAVTIAESLGVSISDDIARQDALLWMYVEGSDLTEPTPAVLEVTREVLSIAVIASDPQGSLALMSLVQDVQANTVANPRYGTFTLEHFSSSIQDISDFLTQGSSHLGPAEFVAFVNVDGFSAGARPEWITGG
jgi:hypothetical protein